MSIDVDDSMEIDSMGSSGMPSQTRWDWLAEHQSLYHRDTEVGEGSTGSQMAEPGHENRNPFSAVVPDNCSSEEIS